MRLKGFIQGVFELDLENPEVAIADRLPDSPLSIEFALVIVRVLRVLRVLRFSCPLARQSVKIGLKPRLTPHHMVSVAWFPWM